MGNVMVSLDQNYEGLLRNMAQEKYNGKKGALSKVVEEALDSLKESVSQKDKDEFIAFLRKGFKFKYKMYKSRDEIYD